MNPWLIATIVYALNAWAAYSLLAFTHEKTGSDFVQRHTGATVLLSVLWPITLVVMLIMTAKVFRAARAERRSSSFHVEHGTQVIETRGLADEDPPSGALFPPVSRNANSAHRSEDEE